MLKLGLILALYAAAACVGLAFVYTGTKERIEKNQKEILNEALRELFSDAEFDPINNIEGGKNDPQDPDAYKAVKDGVLLGLALKTSCNGYGGSINLLVGVGADNKITGVKILEHSETPGLGANANKITFTGQFAGKDLSDAFEVKQDIDAITAATITSRAVSDSVKAAGGRAAAWMRENGGLE